MSTDQKKALLQQIKWAKKEAGLAKDWCLQVPVGEARERIQVNTTRCFHRLHALTEWINGGMKL